MELLTNRTEFINVLHSILVAENAAQMDVIMMAINGIMQGHRVTFIPLCQMYAQADTIWEEIALDERFAGMDSMEEYFADCASSAISHSSIDHFAALCNECMDMHRLPAALPFPAAHI